MIQFEQIEFIRKIYFNRLSGSDNERKAAEIIASTVRELGGEAVYEPFETDYFKIEKAEFSFFVGDKETEIEVTGYGRTGSTPEGGIDAPFVYAGAGSDTETENCTGKIVFVNGMHHDLYRRLLEKKAAGFVTFEGSIFDDRSRTDLGIRSVKQKTAELGSLPGVMMRAADALEMIRSRPERARMILSQNRTRPVSGNVISDIQGTLDEDKMLFTAHYDSTMYSRGAWDNASGCANLMSLYSYFIEYRPRRSIRFIWCGSEEMGLLGSKAYVSAHKDELEKFSLGINIDMTGTVIGNDVACVSGDDSIKNYLQYCAAETAFPVSVSSGIFPSDSSPFAHAGVPFIIFQRGGQGGMHSRNDIIEALSEESLRRTTDFICFTAERLLSSERFPVPRKIPDSIREELENYFSR